MKPSVDQDRYRVVSPLGAGSEASVWLADEVATGKQVALKYFSTQPGVSAFRELNNAMQRAHPNIVPLRDFTYLPDGDSFLVFDYVSGGSLRDWLNENKNCELQEALAISHDILSALTQLHTDGSVHCDIKPENILRKVDESTGKAIYLLTDFGVARRLHGVGDNFELVGSPAYMAPERFRDALYPCSDLYSVGIILYELLAGERPFNGSSEAVARAHLVQPVADIPQLNSDVQGFLHNLLEKDPSKRVQTGAVALRTLEFLMGKSERKSSPTLEAQTKQIAPTPKISFERGITSRIRGKYSVAATDTLPRLIEKGNRLQLAVDFGPHWEFFDGISGQFLNRILSKTGEAHHFIPPAGILHAVQQKLRLWQADQNESIDLVSFCPRASTFALSPDHKKLAWANDKRCEIVLIESEDRTELRHNSLHSTPKLTWINSELLVVTSGPMNPKLDVTDLTGKTVAQIDLPGPVLQASGNSAAPLWVCLDHSQKESLSVIACEPDQSWHQWQIPKDQQFIEFCHEGLLAMDNDGVATLWNARQSKRPLIKFTPGTGGLAISPSNRFGITWRQTANRREITVHEFTPKA